ncbi:hypothetical protein SKAU_G00036610 [Synaphobranchus kaupii]|uniref:Myozenin-2 n=1 Tax=Synaphobranchus kaupii TaxID=118154 RepID=A0A9Q1GG12_SYNKA|nr:hypothetical protein SKAU_G00036610 [Synaphobranchus kaupii]
MGNWKGGGVNSRAGVFRGAGGEVRFPVKDPVGQGPVPLAPCMQPVGSGRDTGRTQRENPATDPLGSPCHCTLQCRQARESCRRRPFVKRSKVPVMLNSIWGGRRQIRSEKYTFENVKNEANLQMNNGEAPNGEAAEEKGDDSADVDLPPETPPNTPDPKPPNPETIAPGYGGPLKDVPPEKFNSTAVPKSYQNPWEETADDPSLSETLSPKTPTPEPKAEGPEYKSFNRVATPFGGFDNSSLLSIFKTLELDLVPTDTPTPEPQETMVKRPTFNRTASGWVTESAPLILPIVDLDGMVIPESDDL